MSKIEQRVAETVLQQPQTIKIGKKTYKSAPPSIATLILVSEAVSRLPQDKYDIKDGDNIVQPTLAMARDCKALGEVAAILILGAKGLEEVIKEDIVTEERHLFGLLKRKHTVQVERTVDRKAELAQELLVEHTPAEIFNLITRLLGTMQLADFFATTTFLIEVNLLRKTKVVES